MVETEELTENCVLPKCQKSLEPPCTKFMISPFFHSSSYHYASFPQNLSIIKTQAHIAYFIIYIYFQKLLQPN
uniref:Uncharacterized protein n=2 Tax=Marmotini TaxID=337730 RepID=A0A8C9PI37_SPEDA